MKAIYFFNIGIAINLLILITGITNFIQSAKFLPEFIDRYIIGAVVMATFMLCLVGVAFWLKNHNKLLIANILLWIPAIPVVFMLGLALLFIISDILRH